MTTVTVWMTTPNLQSFDSDGDGLHNHLDLDSDNDGIHIEEAETSVRYK